MLEQRLDRIDPVQFRGEEQRRLPPLALEASPSAPWSSKVATASALPDAAARCSGVTPLVVVAAATSPPDSRSSSTSDAFPSVLATCSGV